MYSQHGGWYTRQYQYEDERKTIEVYPGKIGHGNYHNTCCGGSCQSFCSNVLNVGLQCLYFNDFRDPNLSWKPTNLRPIQEAINIGGEVGDKIRNHGSRNRCDKNTCDTQDNEGCSANNWTLYG